MSFVRLRLECTPQHCKDCRFLRFGPHCALFRKNLHNPTLGGVPRCEVCLAVEAEYMVDDRALHDFRTGIAQQRLENKVKGLEREVALLRRRLGRE